MHQFDKVEIIQLVHPDTSYDVLQQMLDHVEQLLQSLELPSPHTEGCAAETWALPLHSRTTLKYSALPSKMAGGKFRK